jgi:hypothetical protein
VATCDRKISSTTVVLRAAAAYIYAMRSLYVLVPLVALLAGSIWFAADVWTSLDGASIPTGGWIAMGAGVFFSLVIGCGLMALVFYSNRHGYDEPAHRE